jgi:hypothetical protein
LYSERRRAFMRASIPSERHDITEPGLGER